MKQINIKRMSKLNIAKIGAKLIESNDYFNVLYYDQETKTFKGRIFDHIKANASGEVTLTIDEIYNDFMNFYNNAKDECLAQVAEVLNVDEN